MNGPDAAEGSSRSETDSAALGAVDELLPAVYDELHALARAVLQRSRPVDSTRTTS
jgi:hypothetical protein